MDSKQTTSVIISGLEAVFGGITLCYLERLQGEDVCY